MSALGQSGHCQGTVGGPLSAISGLMQRSEKDRYSITSSARTRSVSGTISPSALAVLRFTASSNLAGRSIGRSAGLVPPKIRPTHNGETYPGGPAHRR
jgi:hypothetical protein